MLSLFSWVISLYFSQKLVFPLSSQRKPSISSTFDSGKKEPLFPHVCFDLCLNMCSCETGENLLSRNCFIYIYTACRRLHKYGYRHEMNDYT